MSLISYVHPTQGTESVHHFSNGNTLPLVTRPFGMNAWSPQTNTAADRWFYHPNDRHFYGLRLTHQPSPWIGDYCSLLLQPQAGELATSIGNGNSSFRPENMEIAPDYFAVTLNRYETKLELAPTMRGACVRLTFGEVGPARLALFLQRGQGKLAIDAANRRVTGWTNSNSGGSIAQFGMHFVLEFDCELDGLSSGCADAEPEAGEQLSFSGEALAGYIGLQLPEGKVVNIRLATSFISAEQAALNLEREIGERSFEQVREEGTAEWERRLQSIVVEDEDEEKLKTFYTCMYRVFLFPHTMHEQAEDGSRIHRSPFDGEVHNGPYYSDIGLWDIYRTSLPLYTLLCPEEFGDMLDAWVGVYKTSGWLPKWLSPGERYTMPGTLIDAALADGYVKNVPFDAEAALEALLKHADGSQGVDGRPGVQDYDAIGFLPVDRYHESVNNTLDFVYGDFCISQIAEGLGKADVAKRLRERSANYRHLFDPEVGFMRARKENGEWSALDPFEWGGAYCEGGPWQCSWAVYHDLEGLAQMMGGREAFAAKLDELFDTPPRYRVGKYGLEIHEMSEMAAIDFGQFAISNQPSFHIPYIYTALGYPERAQQWVRKTMNELFSYKQDGLPGDEDNGSMAAWYIFGALGFYPLCPGVPEYVLGTPMFAKATVKLGNGNELVVKAEGNVKQDCYVQDVELNGDAHSRLYFTHNELMQGGSITFAVGDKPVVRQYGADAFPYSLTK